MNFTMQAFKSSPVFHRFGWTFLLLAFGAPACAQLANSAWPDYGGGYRNQHRSPYAGPSSTPQMLWQFDLATIPTGQFNRSYHQPILLPDGTLVFNLADTSNDQIVALNADGTQRWVIDDSSLGPWLAADQRGYIYTIRHTYSTANSARLRAVGFGGNSIWQLNLPGGDPTQNGPAVGHDGNIYAAVDFNALVAATPTGAVSWSSAPSGYYVNPAVADDGTIIFGGTTLKALSATGTLLWERTARTTSGKFPAFLSPAIGDDGTIFAGQINYPNLVALKPDGTEKWSRTDLDGAPAVGGNSNVYVVPETGTLHALNAETGATLWTYPTGKTDYYNSEGVTIDAAGNLYMTNDQGHLLSLTSAGALRWTIDLAPTRDGFIGPGAPVINQDGVLYVVGGLTQQVFAIALIPEPSTCLLLAIATIAAATTHPVRTASMRSSRIKST